MTKVVAISYTSQEADKILAMESYLMDHYGYNRSQLHKQLIRAAYNEVQNAEFLKQGHLK